MSNQDKITGRKPEGPLRKGWTTGACATAAATAAWQALLTGIFPDHVSILLPGGQTPEFLLHSKSLNQNAATGSVIKDAGTTQTSRMALKLS